MAWTHPGHDNSGTASQSDWADIAGTVSLEDCNGDGVPTSGTNYVSELDADHKCFLINEMSFNFYNTTSATWEEKDSIIIHNYGDNTQAVDFWETSSNSIKFGIADLTDINEPITYNDCWYFVDNRINDTNEQGQVFSSTAGVFENGSVYVYGGCLGYWPPIDTAEFWYWPLSAVHVIGTTFIIFTGCRFQCTTQRIQEVKLLCTNKAGSSFVETTDNIGVDTIDIYDSVEGLSVSRFLDADFFGKGVSFTGNTADVKFAEFGDSEDVGNQIGFLDDSDEILTLNTGSEIGIEGIENYAQERTSYNINCQNSSGTDIEDVNVKVFSTKRQIGDAPSEDFEYVMYSGDTDSSGDTPEIKIIRTHYSHGAPPTKVTYSKYFTQLRKYGYKYEKIAKAPSFGQGEKLRDVFVLSTNAYTVDTEANVSAYTNFAINIDEKTVTITATKTLQNLYDWLQWKIATKEFFNTISDSPLTTANGVVYTVMAGWRIIGHEYLTLNGKILAFADGTRLVTVKIENGAPNGSYILETATYTLYLGTLDANGDWSQKYYYDGSNLNVTVRVRKAGYVPNSEATQITDSGLSVTFNPTTDINYA